MLRRITTRLRRLYAWLYALLCGRHPNLRPWHAQWSAQHTLAADLRSALPLLEGRVLDVGCGAQPYRAWCTGATACTGIDVVPGPTVDLVVHPHQPWPLPTAAYDGLICTQVLQQAVDPEHLVAEMARVLRPGGLAVVSAPFLQPARAGAPDHRRYTAEGLRRLLGDSFRVTSMRRQGGMGSVLALLTVGWVEAWSARNRWLRLIKALALPLWIPFCAAVNALGLMIDLLDPTGTAYPNVLVVAMRRSDSEIQTTGS